MPEHRVAAAVGPYYAWIETEIGAEKISTENTVLYWLGVSTDGSERALARITSGKIAIPATLDLDLIQIDRLTASQLVYASCERAGHEGCDAIDQLREIALMFAKRMGALEKCGELLIGE